MVFKPGAEWNGNKHGRPPNPVIAEFNKALKEIEEEKGCTLLKHFLRKSYIDNKVLAKAVDKILPDLIHNETNFKLLDSELIDKEKKEFIDDITSGIESGGARNKKASSDSSEG